MTDLDQRYRGPSRTYRFLALLLVVALAVTGVGFVGWSVFATSTPEVTSQLSRYKVLDEHTAVANITVLRDSQYTEARCELVAIAADHSVVGTVVVPVVDGPERQTLQVELRTERQATSVHLTGCVTSGQPRPR